MPPPSFERSMTHLVRQSSSWVCASRATYSPRSSDAISAVGRRIGDEWLVTALTSTSVRPSRTIIEIGTCRCVARIVAILKRVPRPHITGEAGEAPFNGLLHLFHRRPTALAGSGRCMAALLTPVLRHDASPPFQKPPGSSALA